MILKAILTRIFLNTLDRELSRGPKKVHRFFAKNTQNFIPRSLDDYFNFDEMQQKIETNHGPLAEDSHHFMLRHMIQLTRQLAKDVAVQLKTGWRVEVHTTINLYTNRIKSLCTFPICPPQKGA